MENNCPNAEKCPIFNGILSDREFTAKSYRNMYCEAGENGWKKCMRFRTKETFGSCPSDLLPNTAMTMEQIGVKYRLSVN